MVKMLRPKNQGQRSDDIVLFTTPSLQRHRIVSSELDYFNVLFYIMLDSLNCDAAASSFPDSVAAVAVSAVATLACRLRSRRGGYASRLKGKLDGVPGVVQLALAEDRIGEKGKRLVNEGRRE